MDLYTILGLPRTASPSEIKRAYRRLARRHHPDVNPGDREADVRFQAILKAYETLIDPDLRRQYDAGDWTPQTAPAPPSFGFAGFDFSASTGPDRATTFGELFEEVLVGRMGPDAGPAGQRGSDLRVHATLSFEDAWRGVEWSATVTRHIGCEACSGSGQREMPPTSCPNCGGSGAIRSARGHMIFAKTCTRCGGAGRLVRMRCTACHGQGVQTRTERVPVPVPAGVATGSQVRVPERGHAGVRGGAAGDLDVTIHVLEHPLFQREGDDVHLALPLAIHEAALGARIEVPTPGGTVRVRVPPGTQSGQRFRLRQRGMPGPRQGVPGDLIVEARLMLPRVIDERSKALMEEFGRINRESVRDERFRVD